MRQDKIIGFVSEQFLCTCRKSQYLATTFPIGFSTLFLRLILANNHILKVIQWNPLKSDVA